MTKYVGTALKALTGVALGALMIGSASAADLAAPEPAMVTEVPSVIDVAFGVAGVTDYTFRGISQTKSDPAIQGYAELSAYGIYAGVWGSSVNGLANDPSMEIDFYGGYRASIGDIAVDLGGLYYYYPGQIKNTRTIDYWELYVKPSYSFGDLGSITGNFYYSADFGNLNADAYYLSVIPKVNIPLGAMPDVGFYVSGELGKQWVEKGRGNFDLPDYVTWNIGAGVTYKAMTLDVRYSDTDLKRGECGMYTVWSKSCDERVVAKISFDTSLSKLK